MFNSFIIGANYGSLIGSILLSISSINPIHSILNLINTFFAGTLFIMISKLMFFALVFLTVYLGAIAVLFLFMVMMLDIKVTNEIMFSFKAFSLFDFYGFLLPFIWCDLDSHGINILNILKKYLYQLQKNTDQFFTYDLDYFWFFEIIDMHPQLVEIGAHMFSQYFYIFIFCGWLLFIAMVGAIILTVEPFSQKLFFKQDAGLQSLRKSFAWSYSKPSSKINQNPETDILKFQEAIYGKQLEV